MLITTTAEIINYVSIPAALSIAKLQPDLTWAEEQYIIPTMGQDQYDDLQAKYDAAENPLEDLEEPYLSLLKKTQSIISHLGIEKALKIISINLSDAGATIRTSDDRPAYQWMMENLNEDYLLTKGFQGIDSLFTYLEAHKNTFSLWTASDSFTQSRKFFINTTSDFQECYNIGSSRRTFKALWPIIKMTEELHLAPILGQTFYDEIKAEILDTINDDTATLLRYIKPALAYLVIAEAIIELPITLADGSVTIATVASSSDNNKQKSIPADNLLAAKRNNAISKAEEYIKSLKNYLTNNAAADKYATYFNSSLYVSPTADDPDIITNSTDNKYFAA